MAFKRTGIPFFELANAAYASGTVTFFQVDPVTSARLATLITLYSATTGTGTLPNPATLDSDGKFSVPTYADERTIGVVTDVNGVQQTTGVWEPALSAADVASAAASAASAAASDTSAALSATSASADAAIATAAAAAALSYVGTFRIVTTDTTPGVYNTKVATTGLLTKTVSTPLGDSRVTLDVPASSGAQVAAGLSVTVAVTPLALQSLLATEAQATTGTVTTLAVTPAGLAAGTANTVTAVNAFGGVYTNVSSGATTQALVFNRYRMTATTAATTKLPTLAANQWVLVEFACTTGATMTVGRNAQTIDGSAADDTNTRYGDVILYSCVSAGAVRTIHVGFLPSS